MGRGRCKRSCIACLAPFQTQQDSGWWRLLHVGVALKIEEMRGVLREMMDDEEEFDDIELDAIALTAITRGYKRGTRDGDE